MYRVRGVVHIIAGVEVEVRNMITKFPHIIHATRLDGTTGIWGSHVRWETVEYISKCHFVFNHLISSLGACESTKVLMRPGMTGDLVATVEHAFNQSSPGLFIVINRALA